MKSSKMDGEYGAEQILDTKIARSQITKDLKTSFWTSLGIGISDLG